MADIDLLEGFEGLEGVDEAELAKLEAEMGGIEGLAGDDLEATLADVGEAAAEEEEEEEDLHAGMEVEEHLRDAVEGSLRLKRMLSRDDDDDTQPGKRRKLGDPVKALKVQALLARWGLTSDAVVKHVLDQSSADEVDMLTKSGYQPDKFNQMKSVGEVFNRYVSEIRERSMPGGAACDAISAFKHRWKLDFTADKMLRVLKHKDLRYVLANHDGTKELKDLIEEAQAMEADDDLQTANALPENMGISTIGRFMRLELIDPLSDACVFGDANLTFALKLAKHRKALGHVGRVIATTFEDLPTLRERYKEIDQSIATLEEYYSEVYHGVDCTRIAIDPKFKGMEGSLGAVYYNYPHSGAIQGFFDGHPIVNWRHENLMRLFFRALRSFVKPGGIVKVASNMGAVGVRYSYIVGGGIENEFLHVETMPFQEWHLHRYGRSYGDKRDVYKRPDATNNQSYNAQAADRDMVYCFCYAPTGETLAPQMVRIPPSLKVLQACTDGPFKHLQGISKQNLAKQLHDRFVTEISGTHVG